MADSIVLINCTDTVVNSEVDNFTGILCSSSTTPASNSVNIADSVKTSKEAGQLYYTTSVYQKAQRIDSKTVTANFTVDMAKGIYYIDTSGGDVTATWDDTLGANWQVTFKIVDATNNFIIDTVSGTALFETQATPYTTGLAVRDSITVHFDGTDLNIV